MAVRFILGRAGVGKTHRCLSAIRRRLRDDPIDGRRLILLVPEQASQQMERAILSPPADGALDDAVTASHRAEVLSFQRLAFRVMGSAGADPIVTLTEAARAMVLRRLVLRHGRELQYYRRAGKQPGGTGPQAGFYEQLGATISELIEESLDPDDLPIDVRDRATDATGESVPSTAQHAKWHDLRLIYRAYLDFLGDTKRDPSQLLASARRHFKKTPWLVGVELWVDGFASFGGEETKTLLALCEMATGVEITLLVDPRLCEAVPPPDARDTRRFFSRTLTTYHDLCDGLARAGCRIEPPLILAPPVPLRFRDRPALAQLERRWFSSSKDDNSVASSAGQVEVVELPLRRLEVEYAVSRVCAWVRRGESPYRYRDIAVIARDLEPYHDLIASALNARDVPFFVDRRRPVAHHPLVELLRAASAVAADGMTLDAVRRLTKTDLLPLTHEAGDELENYLIAHGISGDAAWDQGEWTYPPRSSYLRDEPEPSDEEAQRLQRIESAKRTVLDAVEPLRRIAREPEAQDAADWANAVRDWLAHLSVDATLAAWVRDAEDDGRLDEAEEHRQVWREITALIDDVAFGLSGTSLSARAFAEVFEAGLSGLTLGLVPPMVDQVLVGAIERSRHPDIKAVVLLGFNDGMFPARPSEGTILNDDDRAAMLDAGLRVRPPWRQRVADEMLLAYVALTRASEAVVVTCATADDDGKPLAPSPYLRILKNALPGLTVTPLADPVRSREPWDILTARDLTQRLTVEFRQRPPRDVDEPTTRGRWNECYSFARRSWLGHAASACALSGLDEQRDDRLSPDTVEALLRGTLVTSVSQLENYAACPFKYLADSLLRLRPRPEAPLEPVDVGLVHHAILEEFVRDLADRGRSFGQLTDTDLTQGVEESCRRVALRLPPDAALSSARDAYLLRRSAADLARVLRAQRRLAQGVSARPRGAELRFGFSGGDGLPALELSTPAGRRVLLRGVIDRVDLIELGDELLGVVFDYKRTKDKRLRFHDVYHGLSVQLIAYLLVLAEHGQSLAGRRIRPVGAFFQSVSPGYARVDHPDLPVIRAETPDGVERPRGLLQSDAADALEADAAPGWSALYSIRRDKDGEVKPGESGDAVDPASFRVTLDATRRKMGELADGILDGDVRVRPYRIRTEGPCSWCAFPGVCGFEMGVSDVRFLDALKKSDVLLRMTERCGTTSTGADG